MNIVFCTTVKNRTFHLSETLPQNLVDNPRSKFVVLNYSTQDDLLDYLFSFHKSEIESGRLTVYSHLNQPVFRMGHAKSMAMRCGMLEGADILVTLDADNFTGQRFEDFIGGKFSREENIFLCPRVVALGTAQVRIAPRGVAGRLAVRVQDFIKAGGYDEKYDTWRGEDVDLVARLRRMGYSPRFIDPIYLEAIRHGDYIRFKEYPYAKQYENDEEVRRINEAKHTIVNFGNFGCGTVYKNMDVTYREPTSRAITLRPIPTRIFGIGLQRTATTSLHEAFKILGFDSFHWETGDKARDIWDEMNEYGKSWTLERHYALSDNPIPLLYKKLDVAYPGSKFILTVRDEQNWLKSVERLWNRDYNPSRWEWDVWPFSNRIHRALYGRADFDAETFLAKYRQHNAEVQEYFSFEPENLLVMDMEERVGWAKLCEFLGRPIPDAFYPHSNGTAKPEGEPPMKTGYQRRLAREGWRPAQVIEPAAQAAPEADDFTDDLSIPRWPRSSPVLATKRTTDHLIEKPPTKLQRLKSWLGRVFFFWRKH